MTADWREVGERDEYSEPGDVSVLATRDWLYFWNESKKTVRRYGLQRFQEVAARKRPEATPSVPSLSSSLSLLFWRKNRAGQMLADE